MMVLHAERWNAACHCVGSCETRRMKVRMQVVRDNFRRHVEDVQQVGDALLEEAAGGGIVEIADMLRDEGFIAARDADRVLEPATDRQH